MREHKSKKHKKDDKKRSRKKHRSRSRKSEFDRHSSHRHHSKKHKDHKSKKTSHDFHKSEKDVENLLGKALSQKGSDDYDTILKKISSQLLERSQKSNELEAGPSRFETKSVDKNSRNRKLSVQSSDSVDSESSSKSSSRDRSFERKHERRKRSNSSDSGDPDFSFLNYKHELNKVFSTYGNLVQNQTEFWEFVKKFENTEKAKSKCSVGSKEKFDCNGIPNIYKETHRLNFSLNYKFHDLFVRVNTNRDLTDKKLRKFMQIITFYLDFKQKEKFKKLLKLRYEQANLPVAKHREEIIEAVKNERVVIIAGDTGCGKSTQVPQYLYDAGFEKIGCTQPRRIACISLAKRVAYETLTENRNEVGYQIRFEKQRNQNTKITFITEGLLLRQVSGEAELSQYDVIVLDEVHERHLHGDFLLGVMKCLIHLRPDLKLVLMSATINIELFAKYFARENVKVIQVPGRLFPIDLIYKPVLVDTYSKTERFNPSPYIQIMQIIDKKYKSSEKGDLLIFLSGISEITSVVEAAKEYSKKDNNWIVLMLHSTLSIADQDKVFGYAPEGVRKCIVSTNIAETSITIDGIRFVVDSGKVKEMSYDPTCKMQRLKEFWISKASAEQRKGRAGRTGPGVCYRLYSPEDYNALEKYSTPELQRVPLDSSLLQMISMGLPDPRKFPFIEPPPSESIENSILSLKEHGAITYNEKLTSIGKTLARLPVDITIGKMLIMGSLFHQVEPVLSLAAALSVQNPFTNRAYRDLECESSRKKLESDHGDPITLLNAYREWLEIKQENSGEMRSSSSASKKWCHRRGLEEQRFYEITKLRAQFKDLLEDCKLLQSSEDSSLSSSERILRQGELKLLRSLKRNYKQNDSRKRKQLKIDQGTGIEIEKEDDGEVDIKDIEFRMRNDLSKVSSLVSASTACSFKDLTMLKIILCSGLYPQFACADEFNYHKSVSEHFYHTKVKPFVALHPMSFFGNNPQVLEIEEQDVITIPGFRSKTPVSPKHQLIVYLSLLETTKPYLVNTLRMPAAQTLLLFSEEIDTNSTFSTIVCDSWINLDFPTPDSGAILLFQASKLRQKWDRLVNLRLQETVIIDEQGEKENVETLEYELSKGLIDFMHTSVPYTIKRLLVGDLKSIYVEGEENFMTITPNPFETDFECQSNSKKGGVRLTKNITFNCLKETEWSDKIACMMSEVDWSCQICNFQGILSAIEKLQHMSSCTKTNPKETAERAPHSQPKKNTIKYDCPDCQKTLYLTTYDALRHRRDHEKDKSCK